MELVFILVHINEGVFLFQRLKFLENFYLLCNLISYQDEYRSGLRQSRCYTLVKVFVIFYYLCFLDEFFLQCYRYFCNVILGCRIFVFSLLI